MHRIIGSVAMLVLLASLCLPTAAFAQEQGTDATLLPQHVYLPLVQAPEQQSAAEASAVRLYHTNDWHDAQRSNNTGPYAGSGNLSYHGGSIMQTVKVYTIFWVPTGKTIASGYQTLLNRYFTDINASSFYNVNTQYYQGSTTKTYMQNVSTYGGTWLDTAAYPRAGSASTPLLDSDIQNEVVRAIQQNGWVVNGQTAFFVFTAKGVESCYDSVDCTPGTSHPVYCAYHSNFAWNGQNVIYANMPYGETWPGTCRSFTKSPNGNLDADSEISTASHEHFEAATDPNGNAWYDAAGYENGDKCAYTYGTISSTGSNVTLNTHPYIIQREWNNAGRNCVLKYP
ncbi:MAG: hypothetical protein U0350_50880 [Caldilineaceae bacterium]